MKLSTILKEARAEARELKQTDVVVMQRHDFDYLLAETARRAFAAGRAAGPAKSKKAGRKHSVNVPDEDDFQASREDAL